jgi:pimeloyl-ACP methyl ester carboxylesterase
MISSEESRMRQPEPFYREAGAGSGVVCIHANASTSGQWRGLMDLLAPKFRVLAPDSYDSGKSPAWPSDRVIHLRDEVALIEPVLARASAPLALVGHSYGAAVALIAALTTPGRVRAMALYEPTLFALLDDETPAPNEADGIRDTVADASVALDAGNRDAAAERFIDYWMGAGTWKETPAKRKSSIAASVTHVRRWGHALFTEPTPLTAFRSLDFPVLYLVGKRSPPSARGVARLLATALPNVERMDLDGLGHMGPVTDPEPVNELIGQFLERHQW